MRLMWNLTEYCASLASSTAASWDDLPSSSRTFLKELNLPFTHPFCQDARQLKLYRLDDVYYTDNNNDLQGSSPLPPFMGPMHNLHQLHANVGEALVTFVYRNVIPCLAFAHLWIRLLSGIVALVCVLVLFWRHCGPTKPPLQQGNNKAIHSQVSAHRWIVATRSREQKSTQPCHFLGVSLLGYVCSLIVMTDSLYVLEFGAFAAAPFVACAILSMRVVYLPRKLTHNYESLAYHGFFGLYKMGVFIVTFVALWLLWDAARGEFHLGNYNDVNIQFSPGLYYNQNNSFIRDVVELWPVVYRTYSTERQKMNIQSASTATSATSPLRLFVPVPTPWMYTGDARTGLPFFLNSDLPIPNWKRVFLTVPDDIRDNPWEHEVVAMDIAFPETGHDPSKPIYLILHGINGGSTEEFVVDLTHRRTKDGSTVVVLVARGLMDMPLRGYGIFHAARISDVHAAATWIRRHVVRDGQLLAGVGYSMGAIILNNYAVSLGKDCALDVAFTISGALDARPEQYNTRAQRTWLPIVAEHTRSTQHLPKWGSRVEHRLNRTETIAMMRATNTIDLDRYMAYAYFSDRFRSLDDYYAQQSALGDVSRQDMKRHPRNVAYAKIHNLSIPLCVMHAMDDPISTWRNTAANQGFMRPDNLVQSGNGNLLVFFTKSGGHVGWPVGWLSWRYHWEFMNEAAASFVDAVHLATRMRQTMSLSKTKQ